MNLFKRQSRKSLLELTANQAQEIKEQGDLIASMDAELTRLRLELMFTNRELKKIRDRSEIIITIEERRKEALL